MEQKNVQVTDEQDKFLKDQKQSFNFSAFVRAMLDDYIGFKNNLKEVNEDGRNERIE